MRILVIDDEAAVRDAFKLALLDDGHEVICAASGEEGLERARAARPDLVFLDLRMPGIGGVETLRRLRADFPDGLQIYIVTAFRQEFMEPLRQAYQEGLQFQLVDKPVTREQIQIIARIVQEGPQAV